VTNRTAALRYARALLDVALTEKANPQAIEAELSGFAALFTEHPALAKALLNPAVPVARKRAAVAELVKSLGLSAVPGKLLVLLAERDRLIVLPDVVAAYRERLLDHQKVVRAELTTAETLSAERADEIKRTLAKATGRTVTLTSRVDPSLIGGLVARVGGTVFDASVTKQLQKMRERLQENI
jgi:F-type H+-transporting ATPase subunit delta